MNNIKDKNIKKESIFKKLKGDRTLFICFGIVLLMQIFIKFSPDFLNIGLIVVILTYIYSITFIIYKEQDVSYFDRIIKFTIFVLINSPLFVYSLILFFRTFPNVLIRISDANTWIGFAGSIIGGSMTMFAIIFSIQYQNKVEASKSIPFISVDQIDFKNDDEGTLLVSIDEENNDILIGPIVAAFKIKNLSNFIAKNIKLSKIVTYNHSYYSNQNDEVVEYNQEYNPKNELNLEFFYADSDHDFSFLLEHRNPNDSYSFILEFQIQFYDIFDENLYLTTSRFLFKRINNQRILGKDYSKESIMNEIRKGEFSEYEYTMRRVSNTLSRIN